MTDKNSYFYVTPPIRRRKRKPAPVQPPVQLNWRVDGRWETFTSRAELVAFIEARKAGRE